MSNIFGQGKVRGPEERQDARRQVSQARSISRCCPMRWTQKGRAAVKASSFSAARCISSCTFAQTPHHLIVKAGLLSMPPAFLLHVLLYAP